MNAIAIVRRLYQHQRWMMGNLFDAAGRLDAAALRRPFEIGPGSVFNVLFHLYRAEHLWLMAVKGNPSAAEPAMIGELAALRAAWAGQADRWEAFLSELSEADLDRPVARQPANLPQPIVTSLADTLVHVTTHASYHAAQANNMLRQLGVAPLPAVMMVAMARGEQAHR